MHKYDFVAIGDTVVDAFIKLKNADILGTPDTSDYKICIPFADKVPYEDVIVAFAVGNAANASVAAARLGLKSALASNLGKDQNGEDCLKELKANKVATKLIQSHKSIKTNYHYVLWYGADRTILIKHEIFPYVLPKFKAPKWIYFSSVNETAFPFHYEIADYLDAHPETKLAFQPGKWEIKLGKEKLARLYQHAKIFFCNMEEAEKILNMEDLNPKDLLIKMHELGPEIVVITDGPKGAYAYDGKEFLFVPTYPDPKPPYERTGAGDAFASTMVSALCLGKNIDEAMLWAGINAMAVVQEIGAQKGLLSREKLEEYLTNAPASYKVERI